MSKNTKILVIVLLVIIVGVLAFYYFNNKDPVEVPIIAPENGDDVEPVNGDDSNLEDEELKEPMTLLENYSFSFVDHEFDSTMIINLDKVNNNEYDFELIGIENYFDEESFQMDRFWSIFALMFLPGIYGPALNEDFSEYTYNMALENPDYDFEEMFMFFDVVLESEDMTFEEYYSTFREGFLNMQMQDALDLEEAQEYVLVLEEMFNQNINFRNITISMESVLNDEVYPDGAFIYDGDEKKVLLEICDENRVCHSLFGEDEWVPLDVFFDTLENPEGVFEDLFE